MHVCFILLENLCMRNQEINLQGRQMLPRKGVVSLSNLKAMLTLYSISTTALYVLCVTQQKILK